MLRDIGIDGDVLVYMLAHSHQDKTAFPIAGTNQVVHTLTADEGTAIHALDGFIEQVSAEAGLTGKLYMALSDVEANFRKDIDPTYKHNRAGSTRPLLYYRLREHLLDKYDAKVHPRLEGDDVLGIWLSKPVAGREFVCCSIDKDMLTVPGLHFDWTRASAGVIEVDEEAAARRFYTQVLTGDSVDGYKGCIGCGPKGAEKVLAGAGDEIEMWERAVQKYLKSGQTEADALTTARLAHILRDPNEAVDLWTPPGGDDE